MMFVVRRQKPRGKEDPETSYRKFGEQIQGVLAGFDHPNWETRAENWPGGKCAGDCRPTPAGGSSAKSTGPLLPRADDNAQPIAVGKHRRRGKNIKPARLRLV